MKRIKRTQSERTWPQRAALAAAALGLSGVMGLGPQPRPVTGEAATAEIGVPAVRWHFEPMGSLTEGVTPGLAAPRQADPIAPASKSTDSLAWVAAAGGAASIDRAIGDATRGTLALSGIVAGVDPTTTSIATLGGSLASRGEAVAGLASARVELNSDNWDSQSTP